MKTNMNRAMTRSDNLASRARCVESVLLSGVKVTKEVKQAMYHYNEYLCIRMRREQREGE